VHVWHAFEPTWMQGLLPGLARSKDRTGIDVFVSPTHGRALKPG